MTCQRSGLAFEFAWLPMVMFGGRLGSVLTLAEIQSYLISFCQSEWARLSKQSPLCCAEVLAGAIAFSFHLGVDLLQAPCFKPEGSRVQYRMSSAFISLMHCWGPRLQAVLVPCVLGLPARCAGTVAWTGPESIDIQIPNLCINTPFKPKNNHSGPFWIIYIHNLQNHRLSHIYIYIYLWYFMCVRVVDIFVVSRLSPSDPSAVLCSGRPPRSDLANLGSGIRRGTLPLADELGAKHPRGKNAMVSSMISSFPYGKLMMNMLMISDYMWLSWYTGFWGTKDWRPQISRCANHFRTHLLPGATYLLLQVVVAIRFMDCWEGMECLPLTCCPMFAVPRNLFDDELRAGVLPSAFLARTCDDAGFLIGIPLA